MSDNNYEYNTKDYIEDKILAAGSGPKAAEAKLRIQCYERGDIENATRLKHGYKYKPHESTTSGCLSYLLIIISMAAFIAIIIGSLASCYGAAGSWGTILIIGIVAIIICSILLNFV